MDYDPDKNAEASYLLAIEEKRKKLTAYQRQLMPDKANRHQDDWYATPPEATEALLRHETFPKWIWEPACGDGAISNVLVRHGYDVLSTDLVDRGYGIGRRDFLLERDNGGAEAIITNPPFKLAEEFIRHGLDLVPKVAVLLRLQFLESKPRKVFFETTPFSKLIVFSDRLSMWRGGLDQRKPGGRMVAFAWFVWDRDHTGPATIEWTLAYS